MVVLPLRPRGDKEMSDKITKFKAKILKVLKKTRQQFYDEEGKEITTEEYLELLLKQKRSDMDNFLNKMKRKRK